MENKNTVDAIQATAAKMRRHIIEMGFTAGGRGAHFGPALSSVEIVSSLFFGVMNHDPKNPRMPERDRFVLSKGHACMVYYAALVEAGYITEEEMYTFKADESFLSGHPSLDMDHGIEVSTGSLGNGFSIACGMAKAAKIKKEDHNVFCVVGDGECDEGIIWEAAMNAVKNKLDNLVAFVDRNGVQLAGRTKDIMDFDVEAAWRAFGWEVMVLEDGNDIAKIIEAVEQMKQSDSGKPHMIIANTVKGKGISFMEDNLNWHARVMVKEEYDEAVSYLESLEQGGK